MLTKAGVTCANLDTVIQGSVRILHLICATVGGLAPEVMGDLFWDDVDVDRGGSY